MLFQDGCKVVLIGYDHDVSLHFVGGCHEKQKPKTGQDFEVHGCNEILISGCNPNGEVLYYYQLILNLVI